MKKILKIISKLTSYFCIGFFVSIIALLLLYEVDNKIREKNGSTAPYNFFVILTKSMYPTIQVGDMVITKRNSDGYIIGDIISFNTSNGIEDITITHRITDVININEINRYQTKGDNNQLPDSSAVSEDTIVGKVILKIPKVGLIQNFISTKFGKISVVIIPTLALIIFDLANIFNRIKHSNKKIKV